MIDLSRFKNESKTDLIRKKDAHFMKDSHNEQASYEELKDRAGKKGFKSTEELAYYAKKHGFAKTDRDIEILQYVSKDLKLKSDEDYHKEHKVKENYQNGIKNIAHASRNAGKEEAVRINKYEKMDKSIHKKYY